MLAGLISTCLYLFLYLGWFFIPGTAKIMTRDPASLPPHALLLDALMLMSGRGIGHLPVCEDGRAVGIVTRTNLVRHQSLSAVSLISDIARNETLEALAATVAQVPQLLAQLVGLGVEAYRIGHLISSVTDALTRRLIELAERDLGPAPVPWLWLGLRLARTTGTNRRVGSGQLPDPRRRLRRGAARRLVRGVRQMRVCDGLNACGYVYCPGDMMATNPRWRQPATVWKGYFRGWIATPDPMAQMLASVMFDLRPIHGETALFSGMQRRTLDLARRNSIFRAHMTANSLKHTPPLGLFRGFALIRSGEHKDTLDLKHSGVVPIVDLARLYALEGGLDVVNTRERLIAAREAGTLSASGGSDLIDAYDLISNIRLAHQARQVRAGEKPDNFMAPASLSALERNHLKDAFGVIKTLQSAIGHGRAL
jgi:CBS domain-containing protein